MALLAGNLVPQSGDSERNYPNVIAPIYSFGRAGSEPGSFRGPAGLAVGQNDLLYVADAGNHRVQMFAMNGLSRGAFGSRGKGDGEFLFPCAVAVAADGEVYVADAAGRLQAFGAEGKFLKSWSGLRSPRGVAVAGDRIYVTEGDTHQLRILSRKDGGSKGVGGPGSQPGRFLSPGGVAVDERGAIYVADTGNHRIQKLDPDGKPLGQWGAWGAQAGLLSYPSGLALQGGRIYVADQANHRIQVFDPNGVLLRQWGAAPDRAGVGNGRLHYPDGLAVSPSGGLTVVSEPIEQRLQVFLNRDLQKIERVNDLPWWESLHSQLHAMRLAPPPPGCKPQMVGALAAADIHAVYFFDVSSNALGPLTAAGGYGRKLGELNGIGGLAIDPERGRAYVSDRGNRRVVMLDIPRDPVRRELFGNTIRVVGSTLVEKLVPRASPGYSPEAALPGPLCRDGQGRVYLLDRSNAAVLVCDADLKFLRLVAVSPTTQQFAVGADGTIYATDPVEGQVRIHDPEGRLKSSWSVGLRMPVGIALDDKGFAYVADALEDAVMKVDSDGNVVKRWGERGQRPNQLSSPRGITFYKPDRLIIEDYGNHRAQLCNTEGDWLGSYVAGGLSTPIAIR